MKVGAASIAAALGLLCASSVHAQTAPDKRRSGFDTMSARIQAMQRDDLQNPGMLWVADGQALWNRPAGNSASCAQCHHDARQSMKG
ncbi:MAG TPA: sulfur oxidation c-type cytochrome SoxA, partial [Burkholderiaceae bacterium]